MERPLLEKRDWGKRKNKADAVSEDEEQILWDRAWCT